MTVMHGRSAVLIVALITLAIAIHATALGGFWLYDDPIVLAESIRQPTTALLFDPAEYTHLSATSFTPIVLLSFKFDWLLGELDPRVFYADQLVMLIAAALLLHFVLRRYVTDLYAAFGSGVFLTSWAAVYAARTLMMRHYVVGLVFALAAMLAWRRSKILAAVFYLVAMLSKEVYAPIPLFFICESRFEERRWRDIARDLAGPAIAAVVFLVWRSRMTGLAGTDARLLPPQSKLAMFHRALWIHLTGPEAPAIAQAVWAIFTVGALALLLWRFRIHAIGFLAASLIVLLLPILPLAGSFEWRYSFAFATFTVAILTVALGTSERPWAMAVLAIVLTTTVTTALRQRRYYEEFTRNGIALEGRYVWTQPQVAPALAAAAPAWYIDGLRLLRKYDRRSDGPPAVFSRYAITVGMMDPTRMVAVSNGHLVPLTQSSLFGTPAEWQRARTQYDGNVPLSVEFALRNHEAQWRLGPPAARFIFLTDPGYTAIPIPAVGKQRVPAAREPQFFRIIREDPDGHWTVSPTLPVPREGTATLWRRSLKMKVFLDGRADHFLEALPVRLDRSGRLVKKNALDAKERHEHGDQIEIGLVMPRDLTEPVLERVEVDGPKSNPGGRDSGQNAEKLLPRIDQIDDDQRGPLEAFDHSIFSLSSINTPLPAAGWRNATRHP